MTRRARVGTGFVAAALACLLALPGEAAVPSAAPRPSPWSAVPEGALESIHGVRVTRIAVTAGGGLVDLRFTVVDPEKARSLLGTHGGMPRLVVEGSGVEIQAPRHGAMRGVRLQKDAESFLLFPNVRNAVRPGTEVAVAFGDVVTVPIAAK